MSRPLYEASIVVTGKGIVWIPMHGMETSDQIITQPGNPQERFLLEIARVKQGFWRYARV